MSAINPYSGDILSGSKIGPPLDAAVLAHADAVIAAGGTYSAARKALNSNFVHNERVSGAWALTDDYWLLAAENATQALVSLKQLRMATTTASPTFTIDRGYAGNGSTQFIDTGFIPTTHAMAMSLINSRVDVYSRSNVSATTDAAGCQDSATVAIRVCPRNATDQYRIAVNSNLGSTGTVTDSRGLTAFRRLESAGSATWRVYKNGVGGPTSPRTGSATMPAFSLYILGTNNAGSLTVPRATQIAFASIGAAFTDVQEAARYTNVQTWATAIGAQV